jgi:hypothetical protein
MLLALATVSAALVTPAAAAPWVGVFQVSVSGGSADNRWTLHHADAGACDVSQSGSGTETGSLTPGGSVITTLTGVGATAFLTPIADLKTVANLDRQGSIDMGPDDGDDGDSCPSGGGGDTPPAPDCGTSILPLSFLLVPGATPGLSAQSDALGSRYDNCTSMGSVLPSVPQTLTAPPFVTGLGPAPGPALGLVSVAGTEVVNDADSDVTTKLQVDLRFDRVATIEALDLKDSYTTAPVDAHGDVQLPVSCPAGAACTGTIAIGSSDQGSSTDRAVSQPRWPRPLTHVQAPLGSAKFRVKGGKKARIRILLGHGSTQVVQAFAGERLDVIVRQAAGKKHKPIAFVVGQVRLRAR